MPPYTLQSLRNTDTLEPDRSALPAPSGPPSSHTMPTSNTPQSPTPPLPIPIFRPSQSINRYLIYDISHITYLRAHHAILGVLIGTLPQIPQQSVFLGLPLELQPEEAQLLLDQGIAYVVNDREWHDGDFRKACGQEREAIIANLRREGLEIAKGVGRIKQKRTREALKERKGQKAAERRNAGAVEEEEEDAEQDDTEEADAVLFDHRPASSHCTSNNDQGPKPWTITPTTSTSHLPPPAHPRSPLLSSQQATPTPTSTLSSPTSTPKATTSAPVSASDAISQSTPATRLGFIHIS